MKKIKSFEEFQKELSDNEELQKQFKKDPVQAVNEFKQQSYIRINGYTELSLSV